MTVSQLIRKLKKMPQNVPVCKLLFVPDEDYDDAREISPFVEIGSVSEERDRVAWMKIPKHPEGDKEERHCERLVALF